MTKKYINIALVAVGIIVVGTIAWWWNASQPGVLDDFAKCLSDKGLKFYGAFWCSHCQNQKAMFGNSKRHLPYIECSSPDGKSQVQSCKESGIQSYPTWEFPDGSREVGELPLKTLAEKSGCLLP